MKEMAVANPQGRFPLRFTHVAAYVTNSSAWTGMAITSFIHTFLLVVHEFPVWEPSQMKPL